MNSRLTFRSAAVIFGIFLLLYAGIQGDTSFVKISGDTGIYMYSDTPYYLLYHLFMSILLFIFIFLLPMLAYLVVDKLFPNNRFSAILLNVLPFFGLIGLMVFGLRLLDTTCPSPYFVGHLTISVQKCYQFFEYYFPPGDLKFLNTFFQNILSVIIAMILFSIVRETSGVKRTNKSNHNLVVTGGFIFTLLAPLLLIYSLMNLYYSLSLKNFFVLAFNSQNIIFSGIGFFLGIRGLFELENMQERNRKFVVAIIILSSLFFVGGIIFAYVNKYFYHTGLYLS